MGSTCDILIFGTGSFAQRIACDLAATAAAPTRLTLAGRNGLRLDWIATAARARAHMFARPVEVASRRIDLAAPQAAGEVLAVCRPAVVLQAASLQSGSVISASGNAWTRLVADGGLSATAVFQCVLSSRIARAVAQASPQSQFINCCFPDVTNGIIAAMGLPIACGIGNIAILAHAFAGALTAPRQPKLKMLCHYQNLQAWRRPPHERRGAAPRVWLDDVEIDDVFSRFCGVQLTPEPVIDISGASGVTLALAMAQQHAWRGHVPGPAGLPGGYPIVLEGGRLKLDLPTGIEGSAAIAWNVAHEAHSGMLVDATGRVHYRGRLHDLLAAESPSLAAGFAAGDLEHVWQAMCALRDRLLARAA
jgi:hypothetical protein